ncbi:3-isopropylmalate dehydratase small subunit [Halorubrum sp. DTA98]|uniref:3-isopropylmalate dehydratase small subunit n=1 Tax=Halorubrum sp. DTA98 TaxID=3402163 RepID=UPI003AACA52E
MSGNDANSTGVDHSQFSDGEAPAEKVTDVSGTAIPVRGNDIDTDQIIPARFMKVVTFDGLGQFSFFDQRFDDEDTEKDHPFNEERFQGANVLVVNANFGCGSSREHAPQALMRWGIDAIVGESFAEIFAGNCLALGIPTITANAEEIEDLQDYVENDPDVEVDVDVEAETVTYDGTTIDADVSEAQRKALVEGIWDTTALMGANGDAVKATARSLPYVPDDHVPGDTGTEDATGATGDD